MLLICVSIASTTMPSQVWDGRLAKSQLVPPHQTKNWLLGNSTHDQGQKVFNKVLVSASQYICSIQLNLVWSLVRVCQKPAIFYCFIIVAFSCSSRVKLLLVEILLLHNKSLYCEEFIGNDVFNTELAGLGSSASTQKQHSEMLNKALLLHLLQQVNNFFYLPCYVTEKQQKQQKTWNMFVQSFLMSQPRTARCSWTLLWRRLCLSISVIYAPENV